MTNEIKEILEALKPHNDIVKEYPLTLSIEEQKLLLDYITNLQEENEKVHKDFDELSERYFFTKSRNEKAIEYNKQKIQDIKDFYRPTKDIIYSGDTLIEIIQTNIDILQGSDKE